MVFNNRGQMGMLCGPHGQMGWGWPCRGPAEKHGGLGVLGTAREAHPPETAQQARGRSRLGRQMAAGSARLALAQAEELMETLSAAYTGIF